MTVDFSKRLPKTLAALEQARGDVFPAYAAGIIKANETFTASGGCRENAIFDLASLTKVLSTTTLLALAEERGFLSTEDPLSKFFPARPSSKGFDDARVRLRHLLDHSSGFPWWIPLHVKFHEEKGPGSFDQHATPLLARTNYEQEILASFDPNEFERKAVYSDLGFLLLGWILEERTSKRLDVLFEEWIARPLGLQSMAYRPLERAFPLTQIIETEDCPWRRVVLRGQVHDDNCYVLGGVAGHAGLFGGLTDTLALARLWLDAARGQKTTILFPKSAQKFFTLSRVAGSTRALGWDSPSKVGSSAGRYFSTNARGHLGFTGTSLWIDPEKELIVALLTNRVHPTRANEKIKVFRPFFHDTLLSELGLG